MQFIPLENETQLQELTSKSNRCAILKHNTTCPISKGVLDRLQKEEGTVAGIDTIYVVDLLANRGLSDTIAAKFGVQHQSPQILLVEKDRCIYHEWGFDISADAMATAVKEK